MTEYKSFLPPGLSILNGKKYVVPFWEEVPMDTTFEDVIKKWVKDTPKNVPGRFASTEELELFLAGKYVTPPEVHSLEEKNLKIVSSDGKKTYNVSFKNNSWSCDCIGFSYRRKCKHINQAKTLKS